MSQPTQGVKVRVPAAWTDATIRFRQLVHFFTGPCRYKFLPVFGFLPFAHSGDGLLRVVHIMGGSMLRGLLHLFGWRRDDFHVEDATPFDVMTDQLVVDNVPLAEPTATAAATTIPLYVCMEEMSFKFTEPIHIKVLFFNVTYF